MGTRMRVAAVVLALALGLWSSSAYGVVLSHVAQDRRGTVSVSSTTYSLGGTESYESLPTWVDSTYPMVTPMLPSSYALPGRGMSSIVHGHLAGIPAQDSHLTVNVPSSADASNGARVYAVVFARERAPFTAFGDVLMSNGTGAGQNVFTYSVGGVFQAGMTLGATYPDRIAAFHSPGVASWDTMSHGLGFGGMASWSGSGFSEAFPSTFLTSSHYTEADTWGWEGESVVYALLDYVYPNMSGGAYTGTWTHRVVLGYGRNDRTPGLLTCNQQTVILRDTTAASSSATVAPTFAAGTVTWADEPNAPALVRATGGAGGGWNGAQCWWDVPHLTGFSGSWPVFASSDATSVDHWESVTFGPGEGTIEYDAAMGAGAFYGADAAAIISAAPEFGGLGGVTSSEHLTAPAPSVPGTLPGPSVPATMPSLDATGLPSIGGLTDALNAVGLGWAANIPAQMLAGIQNVFSPLGDALWLWRKVGSW